VMHWIHMREVGVVMHWIHMREVGVVMHWIHMREVGVVMHWIHMALTCITLLGLFKSMMSRSRRSCFTRSLSLNCGEGRQ
jgi:hypothetical protein